MTTIDTTTAHPAEPAGVTSVPFGRLVSVEWRKLLDTRAGRWLLGITIGILALVLGIVLLVAALDDSFDTISAKDFFGVLLLPCQLLLPVLAVVTVTSEWSQRTALTTFTLEPRRGRVIGAKAVAVILLALATMVIAFVLGCLGAVLSSSIAGVDTVWDLSVTDLLWSALPLALWFLCAFGLGMLTLSTPFSIVLVYLASLLLPYMVFGIVLGIFDWAADVVPFFDMTYAWGQIQTGTVVDIGSDSSNGFGADPIGALQWVQAIASTVLWVVVPGVLGFLRVTKAEVK